MKFEKQSPQSSNTSAALTDEQIILSQRFKDRREREEEDRRSPRIDPLMRFRVARLFSELAKGLEPLRAKRRPDFRPIGETMAEYGATPLTISPELKSILAPKEDDHGQD
jgi:hypothetical protein